MPAIIEGILVLVEGILVPVEGTITSVPRPGRNRGTNNEETVQGGEKVTEVTGVVGGIILGYREARCSRGAWPSPGVQRGKVST